MNASRIEKTEKVATDKLGQETTYLLTISVLDTVRSILRGAHQLRGVAKVVEIATSDFRSGGQYGVYDRIVD